MKKTILLLSILSFTALSYISCSSDDNDYPAQTAMSAESLPANAKSFVSAYFNDSEIQTVNKSIAPNIYNSLYSILLANGFKIDFDKYGNWTEIESKNNKPIPAEFLLKEVPEIYKYVTANYPSNWIVEIDKENYGYSVELNNDLELIFNKNQEFVGIDSDDDDDEAKEVISYTSLPKAAQNFVKLHFPTAQYVQAKKEVEKNKITYKAYLSTGYKLEFNASGEWTEIESKNNLDIPSAIIPTKISSYIAQKYYGYKITDIERNILDMRWK